MVNQLDNNKINLEKLFNNIEKMQLAYHLMEAGAPLNYVDDDNKTPLYYAVENGTVSNFHWINNKNYDSFIQVGKGWLRIYLKKVQSSSLAYHR